MRIRAYLFLMSAGILVPVVLFAGMALNMLQEAQKDSALRGLSETAHAVALLVDRELYSAEAALRVLGASPSLATGSLSAFHNEAKMASRRPNGWTLLLDAQGRQLVNTAMPWGTALPATAFPSAPRQGSGKRQTTVSDVVHSSARKRLVTSVNVPVAASDSGGNYTLVEVFDSDFFTELIASARVPEGWVVAIIDRQGRFVGRNLNAPQLIGKAARPELVAAARKAREGRLRHRTLEGTESFDVFTHSSLSGWAIAVAAPVEMIERSARRASQVAALGLMAAMLCASVLAAFFAREHVNAIARAVRAAIDLGNGIPPQPQRSRVTEVRELHTALHLAGERLVQAQQYRRDAEAERQALLEGEKKARRMAEEQNKAKDQFLAMLGHELRNPLAPISTAAQLLKMPQLDQARVRYASEVIGRQVEHMNRLLSDMLDVSRVTRGLVSLQLDRLDLNVAIGRALEQTASVLESKQHSLMLALPEQPVWMQGDKTRLVQVFANLIDNAAKYTAPRGQLHVGLERDAAHVVVSVRDDGEGVAPDLLPRIFDLFSQGERAPDRAQGGLGLGLALVKSLVQLHGGSVAVHPNAPEAGSTFVVHLPLRDDGEAARQAEPAPVRAGAGPLRVMIVDDNIDAAISLALLLKQVGGHQVGTHYDGKAALEWASSERPDVFILDIGLPDMSGYELARRLRAMPMFADATMIALTGYGQAADQANARAAGFDHHLAKPALPEQILGLIA
ncbi:MAG: ATP-binding protein [Pseudomonadota bacterium]